jgi:hypothetical protein
MEPVGQFVPPTPTVDQSKVTGLNEPLGVAVGLPVGDTVGVTDTLGEGEVVLGVTVGEGVGVGVTTGGLDTGIGEVDAATSCARSACTADSFACASAINVESLGVNDPDELVATATPTSVPATNTPAAKAALIFVDAAILRFPTQAR